MGPAAPDHDAAREALEQAALRDPMECRWGYFHYCDGPPAAGGGVGCFAWFPSREDMLEFIAAHQAAMCPGGPAYQADKAADMVRFLVEELREAGAQSLREALNRVLASSGSAPNQPVESSASDPARPRVALGPKFDTGLHVENEESGHRP